ncbi:MAG: tRNA pseudouridine(55) synthase TruB, partial [Phycisphaerales bacterium]
TSSPSPSPSPPPAPLSGLRLIDKPLRRTSREVCRVVRRLLVRAGAPKRVKVGHGGTLDPLATGLLVILVGRATPLCERIMRGAKRYEARVDLSAFTTTDDAEGPRTEVPIDSPPTAEQVAAACAAHVGLIMQRPPAYSALKVQGQRAYDLAREGRPPDLPPRPVRIDAITITGYAFPHLDLTIECGKGTYIRSLARDIGVALGTGGTLAALRRTRIGRFDLAAARTLPALPDVLTQADLLPTPKNDEDL